MIKQTNCETLWAKIYIAGPKHKAEDICRKFVESGLCVNVSETNYIFKYGEQKGVIVELINYPRFPTNSWILEERARNLGFLLMEGMSQGSFTLQTNITTLLFDRRTP